LAFIFQFTPDGGPLPLEIIFKKSKNFNLVGKAKKTKNNTMIFFEVNETFFEKSSNPTRN
jgi:thiol:disulfide interchange protein DsbD